MNKELKNLIENFNKKFVAAQDARSEVMDYLEEMYGIDTREESETIEDELSWCYGIDIDAIEKLISK
jgi:hypothetical protein